MTPLHSTHPPEASLVELHHLYCTITGRDERYSFYLREWGEFTKFFSRDDLVLVLKHIARENGRRQKQFWIRTSLLELIGDLSHFDSLRADAVSREKEAAALKRKPQPSAGQVALAQMRSEAVQEPEQPAKRVSVELLIEGMRKAAEQKVQ